ncbi:hypothetical protein Hanom_Chr14g01318591 [Helianthus anomalus]
MIYHTKLIIKYNKTHLRTTFHNTQQAHNKLDRVNHPYILLRTDTIQKLIQLLLCTLYPLSATRHVFVFIISFLSMLLLPSHLFFNVDIMQRRFLTFVQLHICHLH